jgi:hypothetical protein
MTTVSEIVNKAVSELTPADFDYLRCVHPALAEKRSREYDQWWASQSGRGPSMTALSKKLAAEVQRDIDGHDGETLQEWAKRSPFLPSPLAVVASLAAKITTLEAKIAELEQRPAAISYKGVWNAGTRYSVGDATTDHGGIWIAKAASVSRRPGSDQSAAFWQLAVQRGRDGKPCPNCKTEQK